MHLGSEKYQVLVVDDNSLLLDLTCSLINRTGLHAIGADSGLKAIELMMENPSICLTLTDIVMPGEVDGFAVAEFSINQNINRPVILMSNNFSELQDKKIGITLPRLKKPIPPENLYLSIGKCLDLKVFSYA